MICKALNLGDLPALTAVLAQYPELNWTPALLRDSLKASQNKALGLFKGQRLISFVLFQTVFNEAELLLIATEGSFLKTGCATQLLSELSTQFERIFLEVRVSNQAARRLYEKLGFQVQGLRKNYYAAPLEDAVQYLIKNK
ncbi:MAG: ribosomal protein S18-alanine N-acetyltransferase [Gammaproteobacteria bacterium]|nr:ribosomal protein S18-alanine N-acetyltransferase [Gammaproteobacteria bacterium]